MGKQLAASPPSKNCQSPESKKQNKEFVANNGSKTYSHEGDNAKNVVNEDDDDDASIKTSESLKSDNSLKNNSPDDYQQSMFGSCNKRVSPKVKNKHGSHKKGSQMSSNVLKSEDKDANSTFQLQSVEKEIKMREDFKLKNRQLNMQMQRNAQVAVPDPNMEILDMMPRADIIEDQSYRKAIPKTFKIYQYYRPFSDKMDKLPNAMRFTNAICKDALATTKAREEKYHREELLEAQNVTQQSMRDTLSETKWSASMTNQTKGRIENKALMKAKQDSRKFFQKPLISDMLVSRSLNVKKSLKNKRTVDRLFGGMPLTIPEGTPMIHLLSTLDEEQLYKLNMKICQIYEKNLLQKRLDEIDDKTIVDDDPRIRTKRQPSLRFGQKEPSFEGPPLKRRPGRFKFKDKLITPMKGSRRSSNCNRIVSNSQNQQTTSNNSGTETSVYHYDHQISGTEKDLGGVSGKSDVDFKTMQQQGSNRSLNLNMMQQTQGQISMANRRKINKSLTLIRELEEKFGALEEYQDQVRQAIKESIGKEAWQFRSFYSQEDHKEEEAKQGKKSMSPRLNLLREKNTFQKNLESNTQKKEVFTSTGGFSQSSINANVNGGTTNHQNNNEAQLDEGLLQRQTTKTISRKDAINQLKMFASSSNLPVSLKDNKMRADRLLFQEAQVNYIQRRKAQQRQIVIDNVHYCTMKQILDRAVSQPLEKQRKARNVKIKEQARRVIVQEEKQLYKEQYAKVMQERREAREAKMKEQEKQMHDVLMGITVSKEKSLLKKYRSQQRL